MNVSLPIVPCAGSLGWAQSGWLISVLVVTLGLTGVFGPQLGWLREWASLSVGVSRPFGSCSELIHTVAGGVPATRENKRRYRSTFPVSARVLLPNALSATASHEAKPQSLLAAPSSGVGLFLPSFMSRSRGSCQT